MKVFHSHSDYTGKPSGVLTFGVFDGLHLGHQKILKRVVRRAQEGHCPSVVMTFDPHPLEFLQPHLGVKRLFPLEDLMEQISALGVEYFIIENFSKTFSELTAFDFFEKCIHAPFRPSYLTVGYDLRFGRKKEGSVQSLKKWSEKYHFQVEEISPFRINGDIVSTSLLKKSFKNNDLPKMSSLMGRPFSIRGYRATGEGRGKPLGFPTINIQTKSLLPQKKGVYFCLLHLNAKVFSGVMNIGVNPTFFDENSPIKVEVHLVEDCPKDIKNAELKLDILEYVRDEKKFDDIKALQREVHSDIEKAKAYFKRQKV